MSSKVLSDKARTGILGWCQQPSKQRYRIASQPATPVISRSLGEKLGWPLSSRVQRFRPIILSAVLAAQEGPGADSAGAKREIRNISAWHGDPPIPPAIHDPPTRAMANYCPKRAARVSERESSVERQGRHSLFSLGL